MRATTERGNFSFIHRLLNVFRRSGREREEAAHPGIVATKRRSSGPRSWRSGRLQTQLSDRLLPVARAVTSDRHRAARRPQAREIAVMAGERIAGLAGRGDES